MKKCQKFIRTSCITIILRVKTYIATVDQTKVSDTHDDTQSELFFVNARYSNVYLVESLGVSFNWCGVAFFQSFISQKMFLLTEFQSNICVILWSKSNQLIITKSLSACWLDVIFDNWKREEINFFVLNNTHAHTSTPLIVEESVRIFFLRQQKVTNIFIRDIENCEAVTKLRISNT